MVIGYLLPLRLLWNISQKQWMDFVSFAKTIPDELLIQFLESKYDKNPSRTFCKNKTLCTKDRDKMRWHI